MSILWEKLPISVNVNNIEYGINSDYKTMLKFDDLMSSDVDNEIKLLTAFKLFYKNANFKTVEEVKEAYNMILWFYSCGQYSQNNSSGEELEGVSSKKVFSYEQDAKYILAAFRQVYNIDLLTENLHWWEFKNLFDGLPSDVELIKIIGYRSMQITNDMAEKEKKRIRKLKKIYALEDERSEEEKERDFANALFG